MKTEEIPVADPSAKYRHAGWIMRRWLTISREVLLDRDFYVPAILMGAIVWLIGFIEGLILSSGVDSVAFAWRYGLANIMPSLVWSSKEPDMVAQAAGLDPETVLYLSDDVSSAIRESWAFNLYCLRSLTGGFVFINYILRVAGIASEVRQTYREKIFGGREQPLPAHGGRVVRLAGEQSDLTELSLIRDGEHLLPVYETPQLIENLIQHHGGGSLPVYWYVPSDEYGRDEIWENLVIDNEWLFTSRSGKRIFFLEADATVTEQALGMLSDCSSDLDLEEVTQGFRALSRCARRCGVIADRTVRILLADLQRVYTTGGGHQYTLREWIEWYGEANIMIDARAPLLAAMLEWLNRLPANAGSRIVFNTHNSVYFQNLKMLLADYKYDVVDSGALTRNDFSCPHLVYHRTTADTLHVVQALVEHHDATPGFCCALFDRYGGLAGIEELSNQTGQKIPVVCSAVIYDDLLRNIRARILNDESDSAIQRWLDTFLDQFKPAREADIKPGQP